MKDYERTGTACLQTLRVGKRDKNRSIPPMSRSKRKTLITPDPRHLHSGLSFNVRFLEQVDS